MSRVPPSKLVQNERVKLTATLLNGVALASVVAGVVTPLAALTFGIGTASGRTPFLVAFFSSTWLFVAGILHLGARWVLRRLEE